MAFKIKRFIPASPLHVEAPKLDAGKIAQGLTTMQARAPEIKKAREETLKNEKPKVDPNKNRKPRKKVTAVETIKARKIKAEDKKVSEISTKKPTVKAAPKDNSRKAIRQRKKADKAAGVSKSQMRANKAKSKSEAFMAKAKASKDPSMRAQLKRKSDRLAKRAARKGGSPVKAVGDPKNPKPRTHAQILKAYPGAVKVKGKINTYKYKGTTLKPALFPVESKGKTVKQAIEAKNK